MENDEEIFRSLISGGLIGGTIGALLSGGKGNETLLGTIAGAAILATYQANEKAMQTNLPMYKVENGCLYYIQPGVEKKFIREIEKPEVLLPKKFKLK